MRIIGVGVLFLVLIGGMSCPSQEQEAYVDSKRLYETFDLAYQLSRKRLWEVTLDNCGFMNADSNDPYREFDHIFHSFSKAMGDAK